MLYIDAFYIWIQERKLTSVPWRYYYQRGMPDFRNWYLIIGYRFCHHNIQKSQLKIGKAVQLLCFENT